MTEGDRRLAALAALFAPVRAADILERLGIGGAREVAARAARLAAAGRPERLAELSAALAPDVMGARASSDRVASRERVRVAAVVRSVAAGVPPPPGVSPVLVRLCRERLGR